MTDTSCEHGGVAADRWIDVLAAGTGFAGALLAWVLWRRVRRASARDRRSHPALTDPVVLSVAETAQGPRWQATVAAGWPPTSLEILTFRRRDGEDDWTSEPIVRPIQLDPIRPIVLEAILPDGDAIYDVVVAWTTEGPNGPVPGSRTLTVPDAAALTVTGASAAAFRWAYPVVGVLLAGAGLVGVLGAIDAEADDGAVPAATTAVTLPTEGSDPGGADAAPSTVSGSSTAATSPPDSSPAGSSPEPTSPSSSTTTSTTAPRTGPRVELEGRVEDCRFGAECVIVGFRVVEFEGSGEYVCEFDDGSRFVFRYGGDGADDACARSGPNPSVVVEVDGIRSPTATRGDPSGR